MVRGRNKNNAQIHTNAHVLPAALTLAAALPLYALSQFLPPQQLLPAISLAAIAGGLVLAFLAWTRGTPIRPDAVTAYDVAGAFVLIGFAAGMVSEPDQILSLFGYPAAST